MDMQNPFVEQLMEVKKQLAKEKRAPRKLMTRAEEKEFVEDCIAGLGRDAIMEKYGLSSSGFYSIRKRLRVVNKIAKMLDEEDRRELTQSEHLVKAGVTERNAEFLSGYALVFGTDLAKVLNGWIESEAERLLGGKTHESNKG